MPIKVMRPTQPVGYATLARKALDLGQAGVQRAAEAVQGSGHTGRR